ncbi:hypothetical protein ACIRNI_01840 [Streptomyces sp. NPDC093546]|uniref:hypothetical protein n=1 Tax=Streptomyces sp. NPDC093546 TaxID=3366040 RepID=UPI0038167D07
MVTYQELHDLNLSKLKTAVTQWEQMLKKLVALTDGGDGGVNAADLERKANAADWKGDNATVTKEFTTTTARQFDDMVIEARSIHNILRDAETNLRKHKEDLRVTVEAWLKKNIYFDNKGTALYAGPTRQLEGAPKPPTQEELDTAQAEINRIVSAANETDRITARALRQHADSKYDFDEKGFKGLQDADRKQGIEDADALVKLAAKRDGMSDSELKQFNEISKYHRDNPAFAERFSTKLGAQGTLEFWRTLADPGQGRTPAGDRAKILASVQDNLGITLANATRVDSPAMREWKDNIIALGDDRIQGPNGVRSAPFGFQVLGPLMSEGKWDSGFLNKYGEKLIDFERDKAKDPVLGSPDLLWKNQYNPAQLNYPPGTESERDPVAHLLEALGHNPEASLQFFDGTSGRGDKDGLDEISNWDYLVDQGHKEARAWPQDDDGKTTGYQFLGHALESATLGYSYDDKTPSIPPMKTPEQIETREQRTLLMDRVVDHYQTSSMIDDQDGIRNSLARMAAGHIDSLNYSTANFGGSGERSGRDDLFDAEKNLLRDFDQMSSTSFLRALATDKEAYDTVSAAQQIYSSSAMAGQGDDEGDAKRIGMHSVKMHGMLDEVRSEAIGSQFADDKEKRNLELEQQGAWRDFAASAVIGTAVGVGAAVVIPTGAAAAIAVPLAFEVAGGAAETYFETQTMEWLKENEYDNSDDSVKGIDQARQEGEHNAMVPLLNWAASRGMSSDEIWDLVVAAEKEYQVGNGRTDTDNARGY